MVESLFTGSNYEAVKTMLDVAATRHQALASNIANLETPGYRRIDIAPDFEESLKAGLRARDYHDVGAMEARVERDERASSSRSDGNNVRLENELLAMSTNATNFDVLTQFASGSLKQLRTAITGRVI